MWYNIQLNILSAQLMITSIRKVATMSLVRALVKPIFTLNYRWMRRRENNLYILDHNGQVCYLRGALNDKFDFTQRRIYIDGTGADEDRIYVYTPGELRPKYLGNIFLRPSLEYAGVGADFIVYVPSEIMAVQSFEVIATIELYRAGGKRYLIIEI